MKVLLELKDKKGSVIADWVVEVEKRGDLKRGLQEMRAALSGIPLDDTSLKINLLPEEQPKPKGVWENDRDVATQLLGEFDKDTSGDTIQMLDEDQEPKVKLQSE